MVRTTVTSWVALQDLQNVRPWLSIPQPRAGILLPHVLSGDCLVRAYSGTMRPRAAIQGSNKIDGAVWANVTRTSDDCFSNESICECIGLQSHHLAY